MIDTPDYPCPECGYNGYQRLITHNRERLMLECGRCENRFLAVAFGGPAALNAPPPLLIGPNT